MALAPVFDTVRFSKPRRPFNQRHASGLRSVIQRLVDALTKACHNRLSAVRFNPASQEFPQRRNPRRKIPGRAIGNGQRRIKAKGQKVFYQSIGSRFLAALRKFRRAIT